MSEPTAEQPAVSPQVTTRPPWHISRIPAHLGRARTSTLVLAVLFVAIFALYLYVKPAPPVAATGGATNPAPVVTTPPPAPRTTTHAPTTTPSRTEPSTSSAAPTTTQTPTRTTSAPVSSTPSSVPTTTPNLPAPTVSSPPS